MDKLFQLNKNKTSWSGAMPLDEIAILARIEMAKAKMEPEIHKKMPELQIDDARCLPQDEVNIIDADRAAMDFINRNGLVAFMKKVIIMTISECGPDAGKIYHQVTSKDMVRLASCHWCENKDCANCPMFR